MTMAERNKSIGAQAPLAAPYDAFAGEASIDSQMGMIGRAKENIRQLGTSALDAIRHYSAGIATGHYLDQAKEVLADKLPSRNQVLGVFAAGTAMAGGVSLERPDRADAQAINSVSARCMNNGLLPPNTGQKYVFKRNKSGNYVRTKTVKAGIADIIPNAGNDSISCSPFQAKPNEYKIWHRLGDRESGSRRIRMERNSPKYGLLPTDDYGFYSGLQFISDPIYLQTFRKPSKGDRTELAVQEKYYPIEGGSQSCTTFYDGRGNSKSGRDCPPNVTY